MLFGVMVSENNKMISLIMLLILKKKRKIIVLVFEFFRGYLLFSFIVQWSGLDQIDEQCRDHVELFCKEELWRIL
nr:hypothetical protein CFP56_79482 [Quercus suber]